MHDKRTQEVMEYLRGLKEQGVVCSNAPMMSALSNILNKEDTILRIGKYTLLILEQERGFLRLHGYALVNSLDEHETLELLKDVERPIVADIVNRKAQADATVEKWLEPCGFYRIATLIRMQRSLQDAAEKISHIDVEVATQEDTDEIYDILYSTFNPHISRLPDMTEISSRLQKGDIFVIRRDGLIASMAMFQRIAAKVVLLEQLATRDAYRRQGLADFLLWTRVAQASAEETMHLWCISENQNSFNFYKQRGFKEDGLIDHIMVYNR